MEVGDLVKNKYNDKVGIIIAQIATNIRIVGVMYSVHVDGLNLLLYETDLELL